MFITFFKIRPVIIIHVRLDYPGFSYKGGELDFKAVHKFDVILGFFSWVARAVLDGGVEAIFKEGKTGIVRARTESERRAKVGVNSNLLEVGEEVQGFGKGEVSVCVCVCFTLSFVAVFCVLFFRSA